ncbi:MAG: hypothetical protein HQK59_06735 [Deltaproteobacteria bacterium]|nr:hypothetical protein [Deltaproteobacteria bacterium]
MSKKKKKAAGKKKKPVKKPTSNTQGRSWAASVPEFDAFMDLMDQPMMDDLEPPEGFREVGLTVAIGEFGKPIMDLIDPNDRKGINKLIEVVTAIWTYSILIQDPDNELDAVADAGPIIKIIKKQLKLDHDQATELLDMMLDRKEYLFPSDIQPESGSVLFLRKEGPILIAEFDYSKINILNSPAAQTEPDAHLVSMINQVDQYIYDQAEYDDWESYFGDMATECIGLFSIWVEETGLLESYDEFSSYAVLFLYFIYQDEHPEEVVFKSVSPALLEEFLFGFVLSEVSIKPEQYVNIPPALKLFYRFLSEKGYLDDNQSKTIIKYIDDLEPDYLDKLRRKFS